MRLFVLIDAAIGHQIEFSVGHWIRLRLLHNLSKTVRPKYFLLCQSNVETEWAQCHH